MRKAVASVLLVTLGGCAGPTQAPVNTDADLPGTADRQAAGVIAAATPGPGKALTASPAGPSRAPTPAMAPATDPDAAAPPAVAINRSDAPNDSPGTETPIASDLFPTRVIGRDTIVTIQRPRLIAADSPDSLMMRADIEVYVDAASESFAGTALLPASLIEDSGMSPLLHVRRDDIRFVFPTDIAARHDQILAAAGFAFARQPALLHFSDVRDADTVRRLSPASPTLGLSPRRHTLSLPLERARLRELARREAIQREYERLITTPRGEPAGPTPYQRYQQRTNRFRPVLGPNRGLYRGGIGRR